MTRRAFGELELAILHIMKSHKRITVKQVHQILGEENKYNTVMTVMNRMVEKDTLVRERTGLQYEYWINDTQTKIPAFFQQFKNKIFGMKTSDMVSYLIESADEISEEEITVMEKLLEKAKLNRKK